MPPLDIFGSFADPLNQDQGAAKLVNCRIIVRKQEEQKLARVRLVGSPGLTRICKPDTSPCIVLGVAVGTVWSGHANGNIFSGVETATPAYKGTVLVGSPPIIRFAEDRTALCIASNAPNVVGIGGVTGGTGYIATAGGVSTCDFATKIQFDPASVCNLDNYTVWAAASNTYANQSDKMYTSKPLEPATVNANSFATAEARADMIYDVITLGRTFWPFGSRSVEMWYDVGGSADFAFTPFTNSMLEVGLAARRTLASIHGLVIWVATDRRVWLGKGQSGQPISPGWIDLLLQQIDLQQLTAYMYAQGGDEFYVLTLEGQWTVELAISTMTWIYRKSPDRLDHAGRCALEYNNGVSYAGLDTGDICRVDMTTANEPAGQLERSIVTMWVGMQEVRHVINKIDVTSYMGPSAGEFTIDWSEDRQNTWRGKRAILWPEPGMRRAIARGFGTSRRRQFRLNYNGAKAPFEMDEFFIEVSEGA
jgi:hypothetical protein